jgi:hypothetical protein
MSAITEIRLSMQSIGQMLVDHDTKRAFKAILELDERLRKVEVEMEAKIEDCPDCGWPSSSN